MAAILDERWSATWVEARAEVTLPSARAVHTEPIRESSERRSTARLSSCYLIAEKMHLPLSAVVFLAPESL